MIAEMVRAMREGATLDAEAPLIFSDRVHQLVMARIHRLAPPLRAVLAVAAVIGREFEFALIVRSAQLSTRDAAASLEELVRRRFLHMIDDRFEFTHAWIRESMYRSLLAPRRQILHAEVAMACQQSGLRNDERLSMLVHHYSWGKSGTRQPCTRGLRGSRRRNDVHIPGAALFERARLALEHLPGLTGNARRSMSGQLASFADPDRNPAPTMRICGAEPCWPRGRSCASRQLGVCVTEYSRWTGHHARAIESGKLP